MFSVFFICNTSAIISLSCAFAFVLISAVKYRSSWRTALAVFTAVLIFQIGIEFFDIQLPSGPGKLSYIGFVQTHTAVFLFLLYAVPVIFFSDLLLRGSVNKRLLIPFLLSFAVVLIISIAAPDFWAAQDAKRTASIPSIAGTAAFGICLVILFMILIRSALSSYRAAQPGRSYFFVFMLLLIRMIYESVLNIFPLPFPPEVHSLHPAVFGIIMGLYLCRLFLIDVFSAAHKEMQLPDAPFIAEYNLTARETEIVKMLCTGCVKWTNPDIIIDGKLSDIKTPKESIFSRLSSAHKQKLSNIVLNIPDVFTAQQIEEAFKNWKKENRSPRNIIWIYKGKINKIVL